jgi:hypothetical protein
MMYRVPNAVLAETFAHFRRCGAGQRECQVLWVSPWSRPDLITEAVHSRHRALGDGLEVNTDWLNKFWIELGDRDSGIRVQIHTHGGAAFHSETDDDWPIVHTPGFLSLVIPNFGLGEIGLRGAYLAEIDQAGRFQQVRIEDRLVIV